MARDRRRGRSASRSRSRNKRREATVPTPKTSSRRRSEDSGSSDEDAREDTDGVSLEARVALLEVENATLKAEVQELRKKLVEALRRGPEKSNNGAATSTKASTSKAESTAKPRRRHEVVDAPDARGEAEKEAVETKAKDTSQKQSAKERSEPPAKAQPVEESAEAEQEDHPNAVMLVNGQIEVYNEAIPNNIPPEKRLPLVNEKAEKFIGFFAAKIAIIDLKSNKPVIKDRKVFSDRYLCVFRESGSKLRCETRKRFYYDARKGATYSLDFETHESLVTAQPGTKPDGSLGVRPPRTEDLIVLYEAVNGKISRMWLASDKDKLGSDPKADEEKIARSEIFKSFEEKIKEVSTGPPHDRIFNNYLEIVTVG